MQEVEQRDRSGRPHLSQTNFRVPSSRSSYGNTPEWVEKATKDFLDSAGDAEFGIGIKKLSYTKPELRESIKRRIMAGSKGGRPGQWSARKAQLVAQAYRKAGGGYRGKPARAQRSLKKWTRERWTTADGKPARRNGRMTRYLPAAAWKRLTPAQRRATIAKKLAGDKRGRQFVANTARAASASKKIRSKTLGPSVEEVSKNPNAPDLFVDAPAQAPEQAAPEMPDGKYEPDMSKISERELIIRYGDDEPVKPFVRGNIDLADKKPVTQKDGPSVLVLPVVIDGSDDDKGIFVIVPRVTNFGQILTEKEAKSYFSKTGDHFGKFKTREDAEKYLEWLSEIEDEIVNRDKKLPITSVTPIEQVAQSVGDGFEARRRSIRNTIQKLADKYLAEKSLGPGLRALESVQIYDPEAIDADNDGFVQDATPWMRPALPSSPIIAGLRSTKKSNIATQRSIREAREFMQFVEQYEPDLTQMMRELSEKKDSSLYLRGLKNRKKPIESLALKAQRLQHLFDGSTSDAITSMNDPLRYTFQSDDINKYTKDVLGVISSLAKKGHVARLTNYWTSGDPYKGVNAMVQHPAGFFYEIQFHTPSSYRLKNKLTPLYQKYRDEKSVSARQKIYDEMLKLSKGVSIPKDIGKFGAPENRGSGKPDFAPVRPGKLKPSPVATGRRNRRGGLESSRRRLMTEEEKARFQPLNLKDDEKIKLQPGTTLVFANEYDEIIRTELIGPQVARLRGTPGMKLYIDPEPDNKDEVEQIMRRWDEMFGPVSSPQRQARGRGSAPQRGSRERRQPVPEREDPLDRINRLVDEDRRRRGLESSRKPGLSSGRSPEHSLAKSYFEIYANGGNPDDLENLSFSTMKDKKDIHTESIRYILPLLSDLLDEGKTGEEIAEELDVPLIGIAVAAQNIPYRELQNINKGEGYPGWSRYRVLDTLLREPSMLLPAKPYNEKPELLGRDIINALGVPKANAMELVGRLRKAREEFSTQDFANIFDVDLETAISSRYRSNMPLREMPKIAEELGMTIEDFFDSPMSNAVPFIRGMRARPDIDDGGIFKEMLRDALSDEIDSLNQSGDSGTARELQKVLDKLANMPESRRSETSEMSDEEWLNWVNRGDVSKAVEAGGDEGEAILDDLFERLPTTESLEEIADSYNTTTDDIAIALLGFSKIPEDEKVAGSYIYRALVPSNPGLPESNTADNVIALPNSKLIAKLLGVSEEYLAYLVREYAKDNNLMTDYILEAFEYHGVNVPFAAKVTGTTVPEMLDLLIDKDIARSQKRLEMGLPKSGFEMPRTALLGREMQKLIDEDGYTVSDIALMMDMEVVKVEQLIDEYEEQLAMVRRMRRPLNFGNSDE